MPASRPEFLPQLRLDELLSELQGRLQAVLAAGTRCGACLRPSSPSAPALTWNRRCGGSWRPRPELVDATYGALGVIGERQARRVHPGRPDRGADRPDRPLAGRARPARPADQGPAAAAARQHLRSRGVVGISRGTSCHAVVPRCPGPGAGRGVRQPLSHGQARRRGIHRGRRGGPARARRRGGHRGGERATVRGRPAQPALDPGERRVHHRAAVRRGNGRGTRAHHQPGARAVGCRSRGARAAGRGRAAADGRLRGRGRRGRQSAAWSSRRASRCPGRCWRPATP